MSNICLAFWATCELSPVKTWFVVISLLQSDYLLLYTCRPLAASPETYKCPSLQLVEFFSLWCATMYRSQTVIVIVFVLYLCFICVLSVLYLCCICFVSVLYLCFCLMTYLPGLVTQVVNHKVEQHDNSIQTFFRHIYTNVLSHCVSNSVGFKRPFPSAEGSISAQIL